MALSNVTYTASASQMDFNVPFSYLSQDHVTCTRNDLPVTFTWVNDGLITLDTAASLNDVVIIRRTTPIATEEVDFEGGSTLTAADLELAYQQAIFAAQEAADAVEELRDTISVDATSGLPLPVTTGSSKFLVGNSGTWAEKTLAQTQAILGTTPVPTAVAARFLATQAGAATYELITAATLKSRLSLPTNVADEDDLGTAALLDIGTTSGTIPILGASGALPAIPGTNLTGVLHSVTGARFEHRTAAATDPSGYTEGTWNTRVLTDTILDGSAGGITRSGNNITLAVGSYMIDAECALGVDNTLPSGVRIGSMLRLYNTTDSLEIVRSPNNIRPADPWVIWTDRLFYWLTVTGGSKTYRLEHWCENRGGASVVPGKAVSSAPAAPGSLNPNVHCVINVLRIQ